MLLDMGLMDTDAGTGPANSSSISLNSRVRVHLGKGSVYGTVRWIGNLPGSDGTRVGLELVREGKMCLNAVVLNDSLI